MFIEILHNGDIISIHQLQNPKIYKINETYELLEIKKPSQKDFICGKLIFDKPYFKIENNKLKYLALPADFTGEIYYAKNNIGYIISNDFF